MPIPLRVETDTNFVVQVPSRVMELSQPSGDHNLEARLLRIASTLQSSLDVQQLLEIFSDQVMPVVLHDGLEYRHPEEGLEISIGQRKRHACTYQIILLERPEGEVILTRNTRFTPQETNILETLLCALVYPLRNAILYKRALEAAFKDPVTGISNRAAMNTALRREIELSFRHRTHLSLIMLDVDKFKGINDTYGHLAGDALLKELSRCLQGCIRGSDMAFRYGGEEFAIVLSNTDVAGAQLLAERIRGTVEQSKFLLDNITVTITVSLGVAQLRPVDDMQSFVERTDQALYEAKAQGRNRVVTEGLKCYES